MYIWYICTSPVNIGSLVGLHIAPDVSQRFGAPNDRCFRSIDLPRMARASKLITLQFGSTIDGHWGYHGDIYIYSMYIYIYNITGRWFGTWLLFFHILGMSSSQLTIFFRGVAQPPTRLNISHIVWTWLVASNKFACLSIESGMVIPQRRAFAGWIKSKQGIDIDKLRSIR